MLLFGHTVLELVAYTCSRISIFGWVMAGMYQLVLGYRSKENIGFSPMFLAGYVIGDICNVFGCFWGDQMTFQKIIVCASLTTDSLMALQFIYYKRQARLGAPALPTPSTAIVSAAMFGISHAQMLSGLEHHHEVAPAPPTMDYKFLVGQTMAWCAQIFYISGVVPQVLRNLRKKSTGGVSKFLFMADLIGSIGYIATLAATAESLESNEAVQFLFDELAYLLGTSVCLVLDLVLMVQYIVYPEFHEPNPDQIEILNGQDAPKEYGTVSSKHHAK